MDTLILLFLFTPVMMFFLALLAASLIWVYRDAESRNKSGVVVALLVLLLNWPVSLILWLVFRPECGARAV